jgi:hypothetical protein
MAASRFYNGYEKGAQSFRRSPALNTKQIQLPLWFTNVQRSHSVKRKQHKYGNGNNVDTVMDYFKTIFLHMPEII